MLTPDPNGERTAQTEFVHEMHRSTLPSDATIMRPAWTRYLFRIVMIGLLVLAVLLLVWARFA